MVKSVLEYIPVYWASLAYVIIITLDQIRKLSNNFLCKGCKQGFSLHWDALNKIARPKDNMDGWGQKKPY